MRIILAAIALATMTGCASTGTTPTTNPAPTGGAALLGAEWQVTEINGKPIIANSKPSILFADGRVSGAGSCNRFMGGYTVSADGLTLQMSQMASTMMACPDELMQQERSLLDTLGAVSGYTVDGGVLTLKAPEGKSIRARR